MIRTEIRKVEDLTSLGNKYFLYFKTSDCGVCGVMEDQLLDLFNHLDLPFAVVQVEELPELRGKHLVFSGPTLLLIEGEKEIYRQSGFMDLIRLNKIVSAWLRE